MQNEEYTREVLSKADPGVVDVCTRGRALEERQPLSTERGLGCGIVVQRTAMTEKIILTEV